MMNNIKKMWDLLYVCSRKLSYKIKFILNSERVEYKSSLTELISEFCVSLV